MTKNEIEESILSRFRKDLRDLMLQPLGASHPGIEDLSLKLLIRDRRIGPLGVLLVSPPSYPNSVGEGTERARRAREALGRDLGGAILDPLVSDRFGTQTWAILPWRQPLSPGAPAWRPPNGHGCDVRCSDGCALSPL